MQVISLINQKGGAGKSTLARLLLSAGVTQNLRCAFLDTDRTANLVTWAMRAQANGLWEPDIEALRTLDPAEAREIVTEMDEDADIDLLVIDTPGEASGMHEAIATVSDLILCPILATITDVETAAGTACWHYRMRDRIADPADLPAFRAVFNRLPARPTRAAIRAVAHARETRLVGDDPGHLAERLTILDSPVLQRDIYARMDAEGLLCRIVEADRNRPEPFFRHQPHSAAAMAEAGLLLTRCLAGIGGPDAG